ncbi:hypothetical protein CYMTET_24170 [Cymbomonas tetramitiformis]|uniref:Uncharacterized protein n=1 Tax=Cymbomonas tetramitiformis TaxID=36881 RepID=A0AAE0FX28_9CHLO|nr:hypothetical protein CYMTET_24170 [Cymbomonas tetramitiformis]
MKFWEKAESGGDAKILKASMQLFSNQDCLTLAEEPRNEKVLFYGNMSKYCPLLLDFVAGQGVLGDDRHMLRHQLTAITKTFLEMRRTVTSQDPHIERMLGGLMRKDMLPFLTTWLCHSADEQDCEAFGNIQASWEEFCLEHLPWVKVDCSKGTPTLEKSSDLSGFTVSMPSTVVSGYTPSVPERFTLEIKSAVKLLKMLHDRELRKVLNIVGSMPQSWSTSSLDRLDLQDGSVVSVQNGSKEKVASERASLPSCGSNLKVLNPLALEDLM